MNNTAFLNFLNGTQITTALLLIVVLLSYIAWRLTEKTRNKKSHR